MCLAPLEMRVTSEKHIELNWIAPILADGQCCNLPSVFTQSICKSGGKTTTDHFKCVDQQRVRWLIWINVFVCVRIVSLCQGKIYNTVHRFGEWHSDFLTCSWTDTKRKTEYKSGEYWVIETIFKKVVHSMHTNTWHNLQLFSHLLSLPWWHARKLYILCACSQLFICGCLCRFLFIYCKQGVCDCRQYYRWLPHSVKTSREVGSKGLVCFKLESDSVKPLRCHSVDS